MKRILSVLVCLAPFMLSAQVFNNPFLHLHPGKTALCIGSSYDLYSNAVPNSFFNGYLYNDSITEEAKSSALPFLKDHNQFSGYLDNNIFYTWKAKEGKPQWYIALASRMNYAAGFNPETYKLIMFGNKDFAGQTAHLGGFSYHQISYQSLQFGFFKEFQTKKKQQIILGAGLSIVSGAKFADVNIERGDLFTSESGDSIALSAKMNSKFVNALSGITDVNGIGVSLNIFGEINFTENNVLKFQISDIGFINWFRNSASFSIDDKFSFTGIDVTATNGEFKTGDYGLIFDSLANKFVNGNSSGPFMSYLPFQARLLYSHGISNGYTLHGALEYFGNSQMPLPEVNLCVDKKIMQNKLTLRLGTSALGFGSYGVHLGADWRITENLELSVGTRHIEALLPINQTFGQGYYARLCWTR